ncbi:unnamed protein product [Cylindrotheca closterium]|uniref:Uncharacterized protein n=1 Tax=Cylindrotheca closterium TaxID=2856 RepID=A0AAD2FV46_9STRA|nr:unnamed protein product [Cylindrotheca closterium]
MAHQQGQPPYNSQPEATSLVAYEEPPEPQPDYYYDEPDYDYTGRTGVRGEENEVDYSIYATRKSNSVKYRNPDRDRCRKILFGICLLCCCCLIIGALIAGIVLVLKDQNEADIGSTFAPSASQSPSFNPVNPPTFPPTIDTRPTGSPRPTITYKPSEIPSTNPTTSSPTSSSQPSADSELLSVLGEEDDGDDVNALAQFGAQHSFTVNEQGVYEFVLEFQHNENLPMGPDNYEGSCQTFESTKIHDLDGRDFREPRKFFKRLPDYIWNSTGFQHISLDWHPCGAYPRNYAHPHYDISFFRVRPEDRVVYLACKEQSNVQMPGIVRACEFTQTSDHAKEFYILPSSVVDRSRVPNMPAAFEQAEFYAPVPYVGMQYYDVENQPSSPGSWNSLDMGMSTHGGDIMSWKAKVPYRIISGENPQFHSKTQEYYQPTISSLPDAFSVYYQQDGTIRFQMTGLSQITKAELDVLKLENPDDVPSSPVPLPSPPECTCFAPDPSPSPSAFPSSVPSDSPTIPRFDFCTLLTGNEPSTNVDISCFSTEYECNQKTVRDCQVLCGPSQCMSSEFDQSYVLCIDETSCNKIASTKPVAQFINSQVLCQVEGSCTDAEFLACTCCDGPGCPSENFVGNSLPSCVDGDVGGFCNQMVESEGKTCRELGNPVCTNL